MGNKALKIFRDVNAMYIMTVMPPHVDQSKYNRVAKMEMGTPTIENQGNTTPRRLL